MVERGSRHRPAQEHPDVGRARRSPPGSDRSRRPLSDDPENVTFRRTEWPQAAGAARVDVEMRGVRWWGLVADGVIGPSPPDAEVPCSVAGFEPSTADLGCTWMSAVRNPSDRHALGDRRNRLDYAEQNPLGLVGRRNGERLSLIRSETAVRIKSWPCPAFAPSDRSACWARLPFIGSKRSWAT